MCIWAPAQRPQGAKTTGRDYTVRQIYRRRVPADTSSYHRDTTTVSTVTIQAGGSRIVVDIVNVRCGCILGN